LSKGENSKRNKRKLARSELSDKNVERMTRSEGDGRTGEVTGVRRKDLRPKNRLRTKSEKKTKKKEEKGKEDN